jgi:hypothetical protein
MEKLSVSYSKTINRIRKISFQKHFKARVLYCALCTETSLRRDTYSDKYSDLMILLALMKIRAYGSKALQ